jgi:hypothetical protein
VLALLFSSRGLLTVVVLIESRRYARELQAQQELPIRRRPPVSANCAPFWTANCVSGTNKWESRTGVLAKRSLNASCRQWSSSLKHARRLHRELRIG